MSWQIFHASMQIWKETELWLAGKASGKCIASDSFKSALLLTLALKTFLHCTTPSLFQLHKRYCILIFFVKRFTFCALHKRYLASTTHVSVLHCIFLSRRPLHWTFLSCTAAGKLLWSAQGRWRRCAAAPRGLRPVSCKVNPAIFAATTPLCKIRHRCWQNHAEVWWVINHFWACCVQAKGRKS